MDEQLENAIQEVRSFIDNEDEFSFAKVRKDVLRYALMYMYEFINCDLYYIIP